jgi:hypothetical protein
VDIGVVEESDQFFVRIIFTKLLQEVVAVDGAADVD